MDRRRRRPDDEHRRIGTAVRDAGIGKSALLDAAAEEAGRRGARVLRAEGAEFESDLAYSTLNQLLRPVLGEPDGLEPP